MQKKEKIENQEERKDKRINKYREGKRREPKGMKK